MAATQFATLARVVLTLAVGKPITLPFVAGAKGQEWSETFLLGDDPQNGGRSVLHGMASRRGGVVSQLDPEPCDWCLGTMLREISGWDPTTIEVIETQLMPLERSTPTIDAIHHLDTPGATVVVTGRRWQRLGDSIDTDSDGAWSLGDAVLAVAAGR